MKYKIAYYRKQGKNSPAYVVYQFIYRKIPVCFVCICSGEGMENEDRNQVITGRLREWFLGYNWKKAVRRPKHALRQARIQILELLEESKSRRIRERITLLLGIDSQVLILPENKNVRLINRYFGKGNAEVIRGDFIGRVEAGAGLLLMDSAFANATDGLSLGECFRMDELIEEEQMQKHLKELAECGVRKPGQGAAAVLLFMEEDDGRI